MIQNAANDGRYRCLLLLSSLLLQTVIPLYRILSQVDTIIMTSVMKMIEIAALVLAIVFDEKMTTSTFDSVELIAFKCCNNCCYNDDICMYMK